MKTLTLLFGMLFFTSTAFCQCAFYDIQEGSVIEYTLTENGKEKGKQVVNIKNYQAKDDGFTAVMSTDNLNASGNNLHTTDIAIGCTAKGLSMSMAKYMDKGQLKSFATMTIDLIDEPLFTPSELKEGQELAGGKLTLDITAPVKVKNHNTISNRKVVGTAQVTTPAGTYDCIKISYDLEFARPANKSKSHVVEYWSKEMGMVKAEMFKMNGKPHGTWELTAFKK